MSYHLHETDLSAINEPGIYIMPIALVKNEGLCVLQHAFWSGAS